MIIQAKCHTSWCYTNYLWCCSEATKQSDRRNIKLAGVITSGDSKGWLGWAMAPRLTVGSWITFVVFLNKTFPWFKYVCIKRLPCKISARFHSLAEMSRDQNDQDRKVPWPKRLKSETAQERNDQTEKSCSADHLRPWHICWHRTVYLNKLSNIFFHS